MAIWMGAAVEKEVAADETDEVAGAADAVEGAATDFPEGSLDVESKVES
jgi:hypothetical protein